MPNIKQAKIKNKFLFILGLFIFIISMCLFIPYVRICIFRVIETHILNRSLQKISKWSAYLTSVSIASSFLSLFFVRASFFETKKAMLWDEIVEKKFIYFFILFITAYFFKNLILALTNGGRWDLNQHIAMADRFLSGLGFYYSPTEASSPYFPGLGFLSVLVGKFFFPVRDYILLTIACFVGTLFAGMIINLSIYFSKEKWNSLFFVGFVLLCGFDFYQFYMREFKPDTLVLAFAFLIVKIIERIECKEKSPAFNNFFVIFILAFFMNLTKQHALYIDFALGSYVFFTKNLSVQKKRLVLISLLVAGILSLFVMFSIPGIKLITIDNLKNMGYHGISEIKSQMLSTFLSNKLFFLFIFLFFVQFVKKRIILDKFEMKWFFVAIFFALSQIIGGMKFGGNGGNYEVAMIPMIPYAAISFALFCKQFMNGFLTLYSKKIFVSMLFLIFIVQFFYIPIKVSNLCTKIEENNAVSEYLSKKIGSEKIMYFSNDYMILSRSSILPTFDCLTIPYWCEEFHLILSYALKNQDFKYLLIDSENFKGWDKLNYKYFKIQTNYYNLLNDNYEAVTELELPKDLNGRLFVKKRVDENI